jgi:hypothetical protein
MRRQPTFTTGSIVATPGCLEALADAGQNGGEFLARHLVGDWGELSEDDAEANNGALSDGGRILSAYKLRTGVKLWVITEAECDGRRASTCLLLPSEY